MFIQTNCNAVPEFFLFFPLYPCFSLPSLHSVNNVLIFKASAMTCVSMASQIYIFGLLLSLRFFVVVVVVEIVYIIIQEIHECLLICQKVKQY